MADPLILIVDDEPHIIRFCQKILAHAGYNVTSSTSPLQALNILKQQPVELLLADIRMPEMDGFELISRARHLHPEIAALVISGIGTIDMAIAAMQRGVDGLIMKPFLADELRQSVQRALEEKQRKQEAVRLKALQPLLEITQSLFQEKDTSHVLEFIVRKVCDKLEATSAGVYSYDPEASQLQLSSAFGTQYPNLLDFKQIPQLSALVHDETPVLITHQAPGDMAVFDAFLDKVNAGSAVLVPLPDKPALRILVAARKVDQDTFSPADLDTFLLLARQISVALDNVRLLEELRASLQKLEETQQAVIQTEKLASAGRLMASVAHEINNPLQSLQNCLYLAGRQDLAVADRQKYLTLAQNELGRLHETVRRMLDFFRPGARDRIRSDVNELVQKVLLFIGDQLKKQNIQVITDYADDLPRVMLVPGQFQQVIMNLVLNAVEAMPAGGEITILTKILGNGRREDKEHKFPKGVCVIVKDTGPGITPEHRQKIFEPFWSTKDQGTGMGLTISCGIIEAHGGTITLESMPGKGAEFQINLPEG